MKGICFIRQGVEVVAIQRIIKIGMEIQSRHGPTARVLQVCHIFSQVKKEELKMLFFIIPAGQTTPQWILVE